MKGILYSLRRKRRLLVSKWYKKYLDEVYIPRGSNMYQMPSGTFKVEKGGRMYKGLWFNYSEGYIREKNTKNVI